MEHKHEHIADFTAREEDPSASDLDFSGVDATSLVIKGHRSVDMRLVQYPQGLRSLAIVAWTIIPAPVPTTLTELTINAKEDFAENFTNVTQLRMPDTLEKVWLYGFHLESADYVLPSHLVELTFGGSVFVHYKIPGQLKKLCIYGNPYGGNLITGELPQGLEELSANSYKGVLVILYGYPKSLKKLYIGSHYPQIRPICLSSLPNLEEVDTMYYSIPILDSLPAAIKYSKWTRDGIKTPYFWSQVSQ